MDKKTCQNCKGVGFAYEKVKNLATLDYREAYLVCDSCSGKGYTTEADYQKWYNGFKCIGNKACSCC